MNKAFQVWENGESFWEVFNEKRELLCKVKTEDELKTVATIDPTSGEFVKCECYRTEEPRFLVRDESGRGWCAERTYTSFDTEERAYREDGTDTDYAGNEVEFPSFGEWLDNSEAGDEFDNSDSMFTVIRIN